MSTSWSCPLWTITIKLLTIFPLLLPSIFPSIRVFSNESAFCIRWPKYWSFCFSISPSSEYSGLISFRMDWLDLPAVQGTLKSLLQYHSLKASRKGDDRGWDGWMASLTQWTWVWVSSRSWWWTGRPGVLQSKGSQRVGHGWVTELNYLPQGGTHSFEGINPLWPPLPGKAIKLSFSTWPRTLSVRFYLVQYTKKLSFQYQRQIRW